MSQQDFNSCIYRGQVWHRRFVPKEHAFKYQAFMVYLDLDEIGPLFKQTPFWGKKWFHLARFKRSDFFGDENKKITDCVREEVQQQLGFKPQGAIRLLTNLRYFGYITNPISCYYCFDKVDQCVDDASEHHDKEQPVALLLEVTNTPWDEKIAYVLDLRQHSHSITEPIRFSKQMHVSPFMPMTIDYCWRGQFGQKDLKFVLENWQANSDDDLLFKAGVNFKKQVLDAKTSTLILISFPLMTVKVITGIYWQALRLWLKKVRLYAHPNK